MLTAAREHAYANGRRDGSARGWTDARNYWPPIGWLLVMLALAIVVGGIGTVAVLLWLEVVRWG